MLILLTNQWHNKNRFELEYSTTKDHDDNPISVIFTENSMYPQAPG